jgi:Ni/Co efflux regulator RcnB
MSDEGGSSWWDRYCAERWPPVTFTVHDRHGAVLATVDHIENALDVQRALDAAEDVRRLSDGIVVAKKHRYKAGHVYSAVWRRRQEPEWQSL